MVHTDLHIHSKFSSDGEFDIKDIVKRCVDQGIHLFSITDHNSVRGNIEAVILAQQNKIDFIPGIEIDCQYQGTNLHLLGYHVNWQSGDFVNLEKEISLKVMESFDEMIANLNRLGFVIDAASVLAKANEKLPTGELIAEVMLSDKKYDSPLLHPYMKGGKRADMPYINFYLDYFTQGKPAFVPIEYMKYADAVALIRDNGGVPVVAHPGLNLKGREQIVEKLLDKGAVGLEVFNNYHETSQIDYFASEVLKRNCLMTCGSDFHGHTKPLIGIGQFKYNSRFEYDLERSLRQLASMQNQEN